MGQNKLGKQLIYSGFSVSMGFAWLPDEEGIKTSSDWSVIRDLRPPRHPRMILAGIHDCGAYGFLLRACRNERQ